MALTQLSYATDTGAEKAVIAGMLADLADEARELRELFQRAAGEDEPASDGAAS